VAIKLLEAAFWDKSLQKEIQALINKGMFTVVPLPLGKKALLPKLVYKVKKHSDSSGKDFTTRLVVQKNM
jgi:hypothetical protein